MALLAMCCFDTAENKRTDYTVRTIKSLLSTVNFYKHRLFIIDNNSCIETKNSLEYLFEDWDAEHTEYEHKPVVITNEKNIGTAEAINLAFKERKPGEGCVKLDNDIEIWQSGWVEEMEAAIQREPRIGIIGLKRKDLWEKPDHENPDFRSELIMLPHKVGERWIVVEQVQHVMGTCQMYSSALLDKIGYLIQPGLYGFDDSLAAYRCHMAGFMSCFLPHIHIDHIDVGGDDYFGWKAKEADKGGAEFQKMKQEYLSGERDIFYNPFEKKVNQPIEYKMPNGEIARIKVVTTASDPEHPGLKQFVRSLKHFNVPYHIIIHEFKGFGSKLTETYNYLKLNPDNLTHFLYADTYDSFFLGSMHEILDAVKANYDFEKIIFQAEKGCYPHPALASQYPESNSQWKYLNGGGWFAPVAEWLALMEQDMPELDINDQAWSTTQFLKFKNDDCFVLDYGCKIFQSIAFEHPTDFAYIDDGSGVGALINKETKSIPIVMHGNGKTPMEHIYNLIPEKNV